MGQELSRFPLEIEQISSVEPKTISSNDFNDDITYFSSSDRTIESNLQKEYIRQIQNHLFLLTKSSSLETINNQIKEKLIDPITNFLGEQSTKIAEELNNYSNYQEQIQIALQNKQKEDNPKNASIFNQPSSDNVNRLNYFAIRSLISILLLLIKSAQQNDPLLIQQILLLANELAGQLPIKCLSTQNHLLFKSLAPFITFISELSLSTDPIISKQAIEILLSFSLAKGSLKDCLDLIQKIIFNTTMIFNVEELIHRMNEYLQNSSESSDCISFNYLKSINAFPNTPENLSMTGQMLSSIILSHIDLENEILGSEKPTILSSFSYEFHPRTFQILFELLQKLTSSPSFATDVLQHLLYVCLRLFTRHLQLLVDLQSSINLADYFSNDQYDQWLKFFFQLSINDKSPNIAREASKAVIHLLNTQSISKKLTFIHQQIHDNQHSILINECFVELNHHKTISTWMKSLNDEQEKNITWPILHALIDLDSQLLEYSYRSQLQTFLFTFQNLLFLNLINNKDEKISSVIVDYLTYVFTKSTKSDLFHSVLLGLCFLTKEDENSIFTEDIQSIFIAALPLLTDYQLTNVDHDKYFFIACLIGRISRLLILGLPEDSLEIQYANQLQSPIFTGGYISDQHDDLLRSKLARDIHFQLPTIPSEDKEFLLSIYHQTNDGIRLISRLKSFSKIQQRPLPKSIEEQINQACAEILAVYIKHYRRIALAKSELLKTDSESPSPHLLSLYEYAHHVQTFFSVIKGQGGNCDELAQEIHNRTTFLLTSIEPNDFIPSIAETSLNLSQSNVHFRRQKSHWSKAVHVLKLLKTLFQACLRFKKFMLEKKRLTDEKDDYVSSFNRALQQFIYGNFGKTSNREVQQGSIDEFTRCFQRQHRRALIRLITYQFMEKFFKNRLEKPANPIIYLSYLRINESTWSYYDHIRNCNHHLRKEISRSYYSIIRLILPLCSQSEDAAQHLFYLLNISDQSNECLQSIRETLFHTFVEYQSITEQKKKLSIYIQLIAFNWFRFDVFQLCQTVEDDQRRNISNSIVQQQQQQKLIFNNLVYNAMKVLKDNLSNLPEGQNSNSLKDISLAWFLQADESSLPNELYINQYLAFLLQCIHFYSNVLSICANIEYLQELFDLYQRISSNRTRLLVIKLFAYLIPSLPDENNVTCKDLIEKFLRNSLKIIGQKETIPAILEELIDMFRSIMSVNSSWKTLTRQLVFDSIRSYLNIASIETNESDQISQLTAALSVLGGCIASFRLGSIVKIDTDDDAATSALIIDIEEPNKTYEIQYFQTNKIESVSLDKLQHVDDDVLSSITDDSILDTLGEFLQIDSSKYNSPLFIELKRRVMSVLCHLLRKKDLIEIFMNKPYAKVLAQLALPKSSMSLPKDLRIFNQEHLEQYSFSLDRCTTIEDELINQETMSTTTVENTSSWNPKSTTPNPLVIAALSAPINGWKPYASQAEIESFRKGYEGPEEISIVPMPENVVTMQAIEECGNKHRYRGRIAPSYENARVSFPTFVFDNLRLTEGKWYYCVRLPVAGVIQMGWATNGFQPAGGIGVGDDKYSWAYDGERAVFFYEQGYYGQYNDLRWKANDVCGCGIDINGEHTNIKYWLNGKLLGTAFTHNTNVPLSFTKCDLLPNGPTTSYFPALTIQWSGDPIKCCEIIVSPEDMEQCPLPVGYKPLLLPKPVQTENSIVNYPFHAYLIGKQSDDFLLRTEKNSSNNILRDFVHNYHLSTTFSIEDHQLILPVNNEGLLLSFDHDEPSSLTISFDYELQSIDGDSSDFLLIKFNDKDILWTKTNEQNQQCAVVFDAKDHQIKIYTNEKQQTFEHHDSSKTCTIRLLPGSSARLQNLAVWKYALPQEQIIRLFTYGLFYLANEHQQLQEYHKDVNRISFAKDQKSFNDELLLPFREAFSPTIWQRKKKQADEDESTYFKSHGDHSTVDLLGHQTYLVLNKSTDTWYNYTLVLDLLIPQLPKAKEIVSILTWSDQLTLFIQHDGKLFLDQRQSSSTIEPNEIFRISISLHKQLLQIYLNDQPEIELTVPDEQFIITSDHIELFKEGNPSKNTIDSNSLRISLQSITYLDRFVPLDQLQSTKFVVPSLEIVMPNLIAMGYRKHWIESVFEHNPSKDLSTLLSEGKQSFIQMDLEKEQQRRRKIFSRINPSMQPEVLDQLLLSSKTDTPEQILTLADNLLPHILTPSSSTSPPVMESDWFSQTVQDLNIPVKLSEWMHDAKQGNKNEETIFSLLDLNQTKSKTSKHSIEYSHDNLSSKQLFETRLACEHGLITVYARSTLLKILQVWSNNASTRFPLEKFGDYSLLKFFLQDRSIDHEKTSLIKSMLRTELKEFNDNKKTQMHLFDYLQKEIATQLIQYLIQPSLVTESIDDEKLANEQQQQRSDFHFILQVLQLYGDLLSEQAKEKSQQIDLLITQLFPPSLMQLIFDLFLLLPIHQSKIIIVQFFITLIRISDQWILSENISQFFFQLLIELSSNDVPLSSVTSKKLRAVLTDLIFVLSNKPNCFTEEIRSKFPEELQNLFTFIDVIDAWIDPKKEKRPPEFFFEQFTEAMLTCEQFQQSNTVFNRTADEELMHVLTNDATERQTFNDLIERLPAGSEPNVPFYKNYPTLSQIPADTIVNRMKSIFLLHMMIEKNLSAIDLSVPLGQSVLTDRVRTMKICFSFTMKRDLFGESLDKTEVSNTDDWLCVNFDTVKADTDSTNSENTMFYQAYQQLHANAHTIFRHSNDQLWRAQYVGMHSTDQGGPYRDSITRITSDICSTRLPLFILCPNGRTNSGSNRDCWIPNVFPPDQSIPRKLQKQYRFVGQLLGMAIRKKHYLDLKFPTLFWKGLLDEEITIEDVESIDVQSFRLINDMEKNIEQIQSMGIDQDIETVFSSIMSELYFDVVSSAGQTYELIPGGSELAITATNFKEYCAAYRKYRLNEFNRQIQLISQGMRSVIPSYYLCLFTAKELEELVCGKGDIDIELLKRNTSYGYEYSAESPVITSFWTVLRDMFSMEQKKLFLIFVWGRSTLPSRDEDFSSRFRIEPFDVNHNEVDRALPRAHTCFFCIDLPNYSNADVMYERLNYAITYCSSIDGDGTMNDTPETGLFDSEDSAD